jgi:hypothetical protein
MLASQVAPYGLQDTSDHEQDSSTGASSTSAASQIILQAIVECSGHKAKTLDKLAREHPELGQVTWQDVSKVAQENIGQLKESIEASSILELYALLPQLNKTLIENLTNIEGYDAVKAYTEVMGMLQRATRKDEMTLNINDMRWKLVPRRLANLYAQLEANGQLDALDTVIDHDPDGDDLRATG